MMTPNQRKHFYNRAAFGMPYALRSTAEAIPVVITNERTNKPIEVIDKPSDDYGNMQQSEEMVKAAAKKNKADQLTLNAAWFSQLTDAGSLLREKMTFFWHDHFACRNRNSFLAQQQINTIRKHALENFGDLLLAVSKDPAMLQFLNNQQNKKGKPNENFAREVMELFTLGRGNYTEDDIKNAARAFTGWVFNPLTGEFVFRERQHDFGSKTFRGKTGNFTGEEIIKMILDDKQTALFIATKICNFFVSSDVPTSTIHELGENFYTSGYNITQLLTAIYTSDWFYKDTFIANRVKSPVELIAGIRVHTGGTFTNPLNVVFLQKKLGQVLLQPPNVGGWPNGNEWIDSSSLTFRMSLPTILLRDAENDFKAKDDGDVNDATNAIGKLNKISFSVDWGKLSDLFIKDSSTETISSVEDYLLARPTTEVIRKMISDSAGKNDRDPDFLKKVFIGFMSLPEYQLS